MGNVETTANGIGRRILLPIKDAARGFGQRDFLIKAFAGDA
jgi:hypothetical protein